MRRERLSAAVTWFGENWTKDTVPSAGAVLKQALTMGAGRSEQIEAPVHFADWERGLDFAVDPMPHGHFIRNVTLPDDTVMRVMSEDLIGPDGVHRGYPNEQSRRWNEAWRKVNPNARPGPMEKLVVAGMAQDEPGERG